MDLDALNAIAKKMVAPGKGILAADESSGTIKKRFDAIKVENTEENRRDYREFMFRTEAAMKGHIGGVILFDETIRQKAKDGTTLVSIIEAAGSVPGIKVDAGAKKMALASGETITEGLDGLRERFQDYYKLGARFAKWRAVIDITKDVPTYNGILANAQALARYAALAQENGIVPIVEPEVLMDGDHDIQRCEDVTEWVLSEVFEQLFVAGVALEGMILKPNMIVSGMKCSVQAPVAEVAERTVKVLKRHCPAAVPGIAFLSGGQSDLDATAHLDAMNKIGGLPWALTFSYGRALQDTSLRAWGGTATGVKGGQQQLHLRAKLNGLAAAGTYKPAMESSAA